MLCICVHAGPGECLLLRLPSYRVATCVRPGMLGCPMAPSGHDPKVEARFATRC
jgi:hypothetical protein